MWKIAIDIRKINDYGIGTYICNLLSNLPVEEDKFHYFLFGEERKGVSFDRPDFTFLPNKTPKYSMKEMWAVPRLLKHIQADLYHSPHYVLPFKKNCPVVVTIHDIIHLLLPQFLPSRTALIYAKIMMKNAISKADSIISISENTHNDILKTYNNIPQGKMSVIYNGVSDLVLKREKCLPKDANYILYVGSLKPHKNLITLIKAFSILKNKMKRKEKFVIVGESPENYQGLLEEAKHNNTDDSILWQGYKKDEEVAWLYKNASVFVFPSLYEGFGIPPLEAMTYGTPVLASDSSSLPEVIGDAGILVNPTSPEEWAKAILNILTDKILSEKLRKKGKDQVKKFSCKIMAEKTRDIYEKTLETCS